MGTIAKLSRQGAARVESLPGFEGRYVEADGYVLGLESFEQPADFTPMYRGLPDDLCQSHHWGYVIKGRMIFHRPEGDEVFEEGEAYYTGPYGRGGTARDPGRGVQPELGVRPDDGRRGQEPPRAGLLTRAVASGSSRDTAVYLA
jgi:hypothetical protein